MLRAGRSRVRGASGAGGSGGSSGEGSCMRWGSGTRFFSCTYHLLFLYTISECISKVSQQYQYRTRANQISIIYIKISPTDTSDTHDTSISFFVPQYIIYISQKELRGFFGSYLVFISQAYQLISPRAITHDTAYLIRSDTYDMCTICVTPSSRTRYVSILCQIRTP